jgi:hypothetical protein
MKYWKRVILVFEFSLLSTKIPPFLSLFFNDAFTLKTLTLREEHRPRVLRRIFRPKRDEVTGGWRTLHNEELHNLYSSPSILRMIKSRRMRWAGHVARMGRRGMHLGYSLKSQKERDHEWTILKWILER